MSVGSVDYSTSSAIMQSTSTAVKNTSTGSAQEKKNAQKDTYESGKTTSYDKTAAQSAIKASQNAKAESLKTLVNSMLKTQYSKYVKAMPSSNIGAYFANLNVDDATRAQAQQDISENGYWGVNQTAGRILDFAKAIAGDDIDKLNEMKAAVEKGFKLASDMWGGSMPSITGQTYDKVMQGFDEWEKSITGASAAEE